MSDDLRDVMKHLGERLTDPEVDDMLKEADRENKGRVHYQGSFPFFSFSWGFLVSFFLNLHTFLCFFLSFFLVICFISSSSQFPMESEGGDGSAAAPPPSLMKLAGSSQLFCFVVFVCGMSRFR